LSPTAQKEQQLGLLRRALAGAPADVQLHEAYQRVRLLDAPWARPALADEYNRLLLQHPGDPVFLYLAARAEAGIRTEAAASKLQQALDAAPSFAPPHLLLAEIFSSLAHSRPTAAAKHLDAFGSACPASVRAFPVLRWSKDRDLISRVASRLRRNVATRTDPEAVEAYPVLWGLETALQRSDQQESNRARVREDVERLFGAVFARTTKWLETLSAVRDAGLNAGVRARREIAVTYPYSQAAIDEALSQAAGTLSRDATAEERDAYYNRHWKAALALLPRFPENQSLAGRAASSAVQDRAATAQQLVEAVSPYVRLVQQQDDQTHGSVPHSLNLATALVERGVALQEAVILARAGLKATDREMSPLKVDDVLGRTAEEMTQGRRNWSLFAYYPLGEALIRLGRLPEAKSTLFDFEDLVERNRPQPSADAGEKMLQAEFEARFWQLRGLLAEAEGRAMDALVAYRNAIATYPPRRPGGDRRDEAMVAAGRLWKQLGGTTQGWDHWARTSSLVNFHAGSGSSGSAWGRLAASSPDLVLTDTLGNRWRPEDLSRKTVFMTLWASWCGPCRAELPYVEKLYQRFRARDDVVILALNVDDDPKQMDVALGELKVKVPSVAARRFAYSLVPEMALPSNWILTPSKTEILTDSAPTLEEWMEKVVKAIERASAK